MVFGTISSIVQISLTYADIISTSLACQCAELQMKLALGKIQGSCIIPASRAVYSYAVVVQAMNFALILHCNKLQARTNGRAALPEVLRSYCRNIATYFIQTCTHCHICYRVQLNIHLVNLPVYAASKLFAVHVHALINL